MLGHESLIGQLEEPLPQESEDGAEFRIAAHSLDNWVIVARAILASDEAHRIREWNLDCVGRMGIPASAQINDSSPNAFYEATNSGKMLRILGPVTRGFHERLVSALDANPSVETVALGSGGGLVAEAIAAGLEIRERGLNTTLWNNCYSACPFVFIGGVKRHVWSPYPDLGFHQMSRDGQAVESNSSAYALLERYPWAMGVNAISVRHFIDEASPADMYVPAHDELCRSAVALWIQRSCWYGE